MHLNLKSTDLSSFLWRLPRTLQQVVQSINEKHENVVYLAGRTYFFQVHSIFACAHVHLPQRNQEFH